MKVQQRAFFKADCKEFKGGLGMTPEELRSVTFEKTMRGYRCEDVDDLLEETAKALEQALAAKAEAEAADKARKEKMVVLAQKIEEMRAKLEAYEQEEDTLKSALLNAQRMGENVIREARQKADLIQREAAIKADDAIQHSREELEENKQELARMKTEVTKFKNEILSLYKTHIELLTGSKLLEELDQEQAEAEKTAGESEAAPAEAETAPEAAEAPTAEASEPEAVPEPQAPAAEPAEAPAEQQDDLAALLEAVKATPEANPAPAQPTGFKLDDDFINSFKGISFDD